jgi:hypothetical protein
MLRRFVHRRRDGGVGDVSSDREKTRKVASRTDWPLGFKKKIDPAPTFNP